MEHSPRKRFSILRVTIVLLLVLIIFWIVCLSVSDHRREPSIPSARMECAILVSAIKSFEAEYGYFPLSTNAATSSQPDFTFGTFETGADISITNQSGYQANNSEVISILFAFTNF